MRANFIYALIPIALLLLICGSCSKDAPIASQKDSFLKFYGDKYVNEAVDFIQVDKSYYLLMTYSEDGKSNYIILQKVDEYGNTIQKVEFKSLENKSLSAGGITLLSNNNLAITGTIQTDNDSLYTDIYLLLVNQEQLNAGMDEASKIMDTVYRQQGTEYGLTIAERASGGLLIYGTHTDMASTEIKRIHRPVDSEFNLENPSANGITNLNFLGSLRADGNGNFYLPGNGEYFSNFKADVLLVDAQGKTLMPYQSEITGVFKDVKINSAGNLLICGLNSNGSLGKSDAYICLMTGISSLEPIWEKDFGGDDNDEAISIALANDNTLFVAGSKTNSAGDADIYVMHCDMEGNLLGEKVFGGADNDYAVKILADPLSNAFMVYGTTYNDENSSVIFIKASF